MRVGLNSELAEQRHCGEPSAQQGLELCKFELVQMEWVVVTVHVSVRMWCRDEVHTIEPEHAGGLRKMPLRVGEVLDALEASDSVGDPRGEGEMLGVPLHEPHVLLAIARTRDLDGFVGYLNADGALADRAEESGPVSNTARHIQHGPMQLCAREVVLLEVVCDDALRFPQGIDAFGHPVLGARRGGAHRDLAALRGSRSRLGSHDRAKARRISLSAIPLMGSIRKAAHAADLASGS